MTLPRKTYRRIHICSAIAAACMTIPTQFAMAASGGAPAALGKGQSVAEVYEKAKEGPVVVYAATSTKTEVVVFPAFERRFPGTKVNHVNTTADKLVARAIAEARGGKVIADVLSGTLNYITQLREQSLLLDTESSPTRQ